MNDDDHMWEEFNSWHKSRYGWDMRDDRKRETLDEYTGMVAWYAWLEASSRANRTNAKSDPTHAALSREVGSTDGLFPGD